MRHFDEIKHQFFNDEGQEIPSITQILSIINKKGLLKWANYLGFKRIDCDKYLNEKAMIGTLLHDRISKFLNGEEYKPHISMEIEKTVKTLFDYFMQWYEISNMKLIYSEKMYNNNKYGGIVDLLCEINGEVYLIDFKTSKRIHGSQLLQLAGYLTLIETEEPELYDKIRHCQILSFTPKNIISESRTIKEMEDYKSIFKNSYILFSEYDKILRREWNDTASAK